MTKKKKDIDYKTYLQLPALLAAQKPISAAHDEMLFVIVHQTYELWFKQVLFEVARVQKIFARRTLADADLRIVSEALARVDAVLKHLVRQVDLLETMTPLDFLDFRHVFRSASGFQSMQFRALEISLGLRAEDRVSYDGRAYASYLSEEDRKTVSKLEKGETLFEQVDKWLARTPFVSMGKFDFWKAYGRAVAEMLDADRKTAAADKTLSKAARDMALARLDNMQKQFDALFDGKTHKQSAWRLSHEAVKAALFIMLYRDQPVLQAPFKILSALMDIDETMTLWRFRHAQMVQRMLGMKMGSGGSSGHDYLVETTQKNRIFKDFFALSTFMIPRSGLPQLPPDVQKKMGFRYDGGE